MRIGVITAHYIPEMGYVEVDLARELGRQGHHVRVFTTRKVPPRGQDKRIGPYIQGWSKDVHDVEILRLPYTFALNQVVIGKRLLRSVKEFSPDLVLVIGVGKLHPSPVLLPPDKRDFRLISLFGNNRYNYRNKKFQALQKRSTQILLKNKIYRKAVRNSDLLFCYTPETKEVIKTFIPSSLYEPLERKHRLTSLGFHKDDFYFSPDEREAKRKEIGLSNEDICILTATRVIPNKRPDEVITDMERIIEEDPRVHYVLIGFSTDPYSKRIWKMMDESPFAENLHHFSFMNQKKMRQFYNAADIGLWTQASIAIQKAMGTGLPVILPNTPPLSHLLEEGINGYYYRDEERKKTLEEGIKDLRLHDRSAREERQEKNIEELSYTGIVKDILEESQTPVR